MILQDHEITLEQTEDKSYLVELVKQNKYNLLNDQGIKKGLEYIRFLWIGRASGVIGGVLFFCYIPHLNIWTFDAYKEDQRLKNLDNRGNFSYRAGRLVIDWFFTTEITRELFTMHDQKNRGATIVCKKLGFDTVGIENGFVIMRKGIKNGTF